MLCHTLKVWSQKITKLSQIILYSTMLTAHLIEDMRRNSQITELPSRGRAP